jgi:phytoene dehydrogenase-like protein
VPGLRQHTKTRLILTPEDFRARTHQKHHSFGGVPPIIGNKPPAHKTPIQGLWFIGAQKVAKQILNGQ